MSAMDAHRALNTLSYVVGAQRGPEAKLTSWELISQGHDSLLQQKRLASLPAPVRRHNPKSLNRFDIAATCDLNENEEEGQDEEEMQPHVDEAEQQALQSMSLSPRAPMDPVPRHKSFTSDSKSYMALRGHRASLIAEVPESIDNAFVSTLKAKARLLSGLEDATIVSRERATPSAGDVTPKMKPGAFRTPSLQPLDLSPFARANTPMPATAAANALLSQLQSASKPASSNRPKPTRRNTVSQLQLAPSGFSSAGSMSPVNSRHGSLSGNTLLPGLPIVGGGRVPSTGVGSSAASSAVPEPPPRGQSTPLPLSARAGSGGLGQGSAGLRASDATAGSLNSALLTLRAGSLGAASAGVETGSSVHSAPLTPLMPGPPPQPRIGCGVVGRHVSLSCLLPTHLEDERIHPVTSSAERPKVSFTSSPRRSEAQLQLPSLLDQSVAAAAEVVAVSTRGMSFTFGSNGPTAPMAFDGEALRKLAPPSRARLVSRLSDAPPQPARSSSAMGFVPGTAALAEGQQPSDIISRFSKWVKGST